MHRLPGHSIRGRVMVMEPEFDWGDDAPYTTSVESATMLMQSLQAITKERETPILMAALGAELKRRGVDFSKVDFAALKAE